MPKRSSFKVSKRSVDALRADHRDAVFWDRDLPGFGVRVHRTGRKSYVVQTRGPAGLKRVTIGRHGEVTPEEARKYAREIIDRIKRGMVPTPDEAPAPELTVADLAERCMRAHVAVNCSAGTMKNYRNAIDGYIVPELGALPLSAVDRAEVSALHYRLRSTPHQANRVIKVLSKMLSLAEAWGVVPPGTNPCKAVRLYREGKRERFLREDEYRRLGRVLDEAQAEGSLGPHGIAAIRLLLLTGCRRDEIVTLRWDDVDRAAGELRLRETKSGARMIPLTPAVEEVLAEIPRVPGNPWVIAGAKAGSHMANIDKVWRRLREQAGLEDVRIHDLRHSYASRALALGESITMIGRLLGHTKVGTTARYAHLARDTERASAARVGGSIGIDIMPEDAVGA